MSERPTQTAIPGSADEGPGVPVGGKPIERTQTAPPGFVLMPREPRPELVAAFWRSKNAGESDYDAYRAMIRAAEGER